MTCERRRSPTRCRRPGAAVARGLFVWHPAAVPALTVLEFIRATQSKEWKALEALHGDKTGAQILTDLTKWMDREGSLATLRHGFKCVSTHCKPRPWA